MSSEAVITSTTSATRDVVIRDTPGVVRQEKNKVLPRTLRDGVRMLGASIAMGSAMDLAIEYLELPDGDTVWIAPDLCYAIISVELDGATRRHVAEGLQEFHRLLFGARADGARVAMEQ